MRRWTLRRTFKSEVDHKPRKFLGDVCTHSVEFRPIKGRYVTLVLCGSISWENHSLNESCLPSLSKPDWLAIELWHFITNKLPIRCEKAELLWTPVQAIVPQTDALINSVTMRTARSGTLIFTSSSRMFASRRRLYVFYSYVFSL